MALSTAQQTLLAAARTYLTAWETYVDTLSAGDEIRVCGLDQGNSDYGDNMRTKTVVGCTASTDKTVGIVHIDDGETILQVPNPGWLTLPIAYFATNAAGEVA